MRSLLTRESYIPENATHTRHDDIKVDVYEYYLASGKPALLVFGGRRSKPDMYYRYSNEESRAQALKGYLARARKSLEHKAARRAEKKQPNTLEVGAILYTSWGYDQTNVDFYQVVDKPSAHFVTIRKVAQSTVRTNGSMDYVAPVEGSFTEDGKRVKADANNSVRISDGRGRAYEWNGEPKYQTAWGYGH